MSNPADLFYSKDHEWIRFDGDSATVGVTDFAQRSLGDIVFIELPKTGQKFEHGDSVGTIESVKAVSEIYAPIAGEIVAVNPELDESPEVVNEDPYGEGWLYKIKLSGKRDTSNLLDAAAYTAFTASEN